MPHDLVDFEAQVLERSRDVPVVVDFWAPWCGPCQTLGPLLDKLAEAAGGKWDLVKINTEEDPGLAGKFGIRGIPNVKLFVNGQVVDEFLGLLPEDGILKWLKPHLPSPHAAAIAQAETLLGEGSHAAAAAILETVTTAEPDNDFALFLLAQALLPDSPEKVHETVRKIPGHSDYWDRAEGLRDLARLTAEAGNPDALPAGDAKEPFLGVLRHILAGDYESAFEGIIAVLKIDREYHKGAVKETCKALFKFLGMRHPITEKYQREVASLLFS